MLRDAASVDPEERTDAYSHKGLYKQFVDEVLPLSDFVLLQYPENCSIEPVLGNQGYDAIVYDCHGQECDRIEIKKPHDGAERAEDGRLVLERGFGNVHVGRPGDELRPLIPFARATCRDAALRDYSDCTLLIVLPVLEPPGIAEFQQRFEQELATLATQVCGLLATQKPAFRPKRTFLFVPPQRLVQVSSTEGDRNDHAKMKNGA